MLAPPFGFASLAGRGCSLARAPGGRGWVRWRGASSRGRPPRGQVTSVAVALPAVVPGTSAPASLVISCRPKQPAGAPLPLLPPKAKFQAELPLALDGGPWWDPLLEVSFVPQAVKRG